MKLIATMALMLNLGVAGVYAQRSVNMTFQGTGAASVINLQQPNTSNNEDNLAGTGNLGTFTFRNVKALNDFPQPSSTCAGPTHLYFSTTGGPNPIGAGVFRFQDGSLLMVALFQETDCIDLGPQPAHCILTFQITGGTGRFAHASGAITMTEDAVVVLSDAYNNPVYFASTGVFRELFPE